jgi:hypothetical protein
VRDIYTTGNAFLLRESTQNLARNDVLLAYYVEALRRQSQTTEQPDVRGYNLLGCGVHEKSYIIHAIQPLQRALRQQRTIELYTIGCKAIGSTKD